jgi:predicted lipoprotein
MRYISSIFLIAAIISTLFLTSCGSSDNPTPVDKSFDRQAILINWADNIIIPSYNNFKTKLDAMVTASSAFTITPNEESLSALRNTLVDAYVEWQKVELFQFGPGDTYDMRTFFNIYPTNITSISTYINDPSLSLDLISASSSQGFPALDYLINGTGDTDAAIVAYYTDVTEGPKRIAYLQKLISRMSERLSNVINEWSSTGRSTFISNTGLDVNSSMAKVVNAYVLNYERFVRSGKIGIPSGSMVTGIGTPLPEKVEAYYKQDISLELARTAHHASVDFFNGVATLTGTEGPGFKSYLDALEAKDASTGVMLSTLINNQFETIANKLNTLSPNFVEQISTDNNAMNATYIEMQKVVVLLKVDMTSAMSITITYTDNDGD